jgi:uncharacterized protein YvpB
MKKLIVVLIIAITAALSAASFFLYRHIQGSQPSGITKLGHRNAEFYVYQNGNFLRAFERRADAIDFASRYVQTHIERIGRDEWIWDNHPQFLISRHDGDYLFATITEALAFAADTEDVSIINRRNKAVIWDKTDRLPSEHRIKGVPLIAQNPELPRGCEVTSLAMLLHYYGIGVSKMDLAMQIEKDPTVFRVENGVVIFGDARKGFVGDMYNRANRGYGVYAGPIYELLKDYIGTASINLTGCRFSDLYYFIAKDKPVFVITNFTHRLLPGSRFTVWYTESGERLTATYSMHAVVITGYDERYIYFNDPLHTNGESQALKSDFIAAWGQMGYQAVTYFD